VLPRAAAAGLRTARIGVCGESMGGYGALLIAERLAARVSAVAALSPAVFATYADARAANAAAFDGPADFARNDVVSGLGALRQVPAWIACGTDDPFQPEAALVRARLSALTHRPLPGGIMAGCHDGAFWGRHWPSALEFIAAHQVAGAH